jgi:hypothetical protein
MFKNAENSNKKEMEEKTYHTAKSQSAERPT